MFWLLALLLMMILITRAVKYRDECYNFSYIPIYLLQQLFKDDPAEPLFIILYIFCNFYIYISALYINFLIMAVPNFSELNLLITTDPKLVYAAIGTAMVLVVVIRHLCIKLGRFLGISD